MPAKIIPIPAEATQTLWPPVSTTVTAVALAKPREAAALALRAIDTTSQNTNFIGPNNRGGHQGLYNDLRSLRTAAENVVNDDGANEAISASLNLKLSQAFVTAIARADLIANRDTESALSVKLCRELKAALENAKAQ